ncbi:MAG: hypothetical protein EXR62_10965 [Chloroflexi bacterium]|nr:hypothetical protein [Chloroflexota bacterium]
MAFQSVASAVALIMPSIVLHPQAMLMPVNFASSMSGQRAFREYRTLKLLHLLDLDIAPQPLWFDPSCSILPFPVVMYAWLDGDPLPSIPSRDQLAAVCATFQTFHAIRPDTLPTALASQDLGIQPAWFHWFSFEPYLRELHKFVNDYGPWLSSNEPDGPELLSRLLRLVDLCSTFVRDTQAQPGPGNFPLCLCRVDPNLANTLWGADARLRWIDWEYSGWGDPAFELADLRWHASTATITGSDHAWLRQTYRAPAADPDFWLRLAVWDRLIATRWPFLVLRSLWTLSHGPDRVRLTHAPGDPIELRHRLIQFISRAEHLLWKG